MKTLDKLHEMWFKAHTPERFGQWFVNRYIRGTWPELYYEVNVNDARWQIAEWLRAHCYEETLPPQV